MIRLVALLEYWRALGKNIEHCDEYTLHMVCPLHTESSLHGNTHTLDARGSEVLLFCAAFVCDVEGCH